MNLRLQRTSLTLLCLLLSSFLAGCSKPAANVSGTLTAGGQPIAGADLFIAPQSEPDKKYFGLTLPDGDIQIDPKDGIYPGQYKIVVMTYKMRDGSPLPDGEEGDAAKENGLAVKQGYVFKWSIEAGDNDLKLDTDQAQETNEPLVKDSL